MLNKLYQSLTHTMASRILLLAVASYFLVFFTWCYLKFISFGYFDFDLAVHDQVLWNLCHGSAYSSILGVNFLGNHIHFISFVVVPIYLIFNHSLTLVFLQTLALALAAIPIYKTATMILGYRLGLMVGLIYLLYPGLGYTNLYEFHPTVFATLFLAWMFYYFYTEKMGLFIVFMALSLSCQENVSLVVAALGVYALCTKRNKRFALIALMSGVLYFILCVKVLLPLFNPNTIQFMKIYGHLGGSFQEILKTIFTNPIKMYHILVQPEKMLYLKDIFLSLSFIPLLSPFSLILSLPLLAQHLLSLRASEVTIYYHYMAELIPPLFVAFIWGLYKVRETSFFKGKEYILAASILIIAVANNILLGPHFSFEKQWRKFSSDSSFVQKERMIQDVPKEAAIVSTFEFLPHLTHRPELYSFHHVYSGLYTLSMKKYVLPKSTQYALIDFNDELTFKGFYNSKNYEQMKDFMNESLWGSVEVKDSMVLFKKGVKNKYPLFHFLNAPVRKMQLLSLIIDDHVQLSGYNIHLQSDLLKLSLYWMLLSPESKDINIYLEFMNQDGQVLYRKKQPICYRIWPTQAWTKDQRIEEHQYITIPPWLNGKFQYVMMGFYDYQTNEGLKTNSTDALGRVRLELTGKLQE